MFLFVNFSHPAEFPHCKVEKFACFFLWLLNCEKWGCGREKKNYLLSLLFQVWYYLLLFYLFIGMLLNTYAYLKKKKNVAGIQLSKVILYVYWKRVNKNFFFFFCFFFNNLQLLDIWLRSFSCYYYHLWFSERVRIYVFWFHCNARLIEDNHFISERK